MAERARPDTENAEANHVSADLLNLRFRISPEEAGSPEPLTTLAVVLVCPSLSMHLARRPY